jgi:hypothetical protein
VSVEGLRAWQARARAPVLDAIVASAASRMVTVAGSLTCVTMGGPVGIDGATHVAIVAKTLMYRDSGVLPAT